MEQSANTHAGRSGTLPSSRPPTLNRCRSRSQRSRIGMRFPSSAADDDQPFMRYRQKTMNKHSAHTGTHMWTMKRSCSNSPEGN